MFKNVMDFEKNQQISYKDRSAQERLETRKDESREVGNDDCGELWPQLSNKLGN